jgi:hypothetical protein
VAVLSDPTDGSVGVIRASLASGKGILKTARELKVGSGTVQRVKRATVKRG